MPELDQLLVKIDASTELLRRELKRGNDSVDKFDRNVSRRARRVQRQFDTLGKSVKRSLAGLVAALSVQQFARFTRSAIAAGDAIGKAAQTAGIGAEQLQELRFAFGQLAGTTDKEVDESIRRFNRRIGLAAQGMGEAKKTIELMGIALSDASGNVRQTDDVLEEVLQNLAAIESDSIRAARASQVFGEDAGPRLAAALGNGIDAMTALRDVTPGVLSDEQVAKAEALTDAFDRMSRQVGGALKGAFIDATAALLRFFEVQEAFNTIQLIDARIATLREEVSRFEGARGVARAGAGQAIASRQAEIQRLQAQRDRITNQGTGGTGGSQPSLEAVTSTARRLPSPFVGPPQLSATGLSDTARTLDFEMQLKAMRDEVQAVIGSVQMLDEETKQRTESMKDNWAELGSTVGFTLQNELSNVFLGIETDWNDMIRRMIANWVAQQTLLGIGAAFAGGPVGRFIGGVLGRAAGGPVANRRAHVVGERGPELFVPGAAGRIVPAGQMAGAAISISTAIDARGADPALLQRLCPALDQRDRNLKAEIATMLRRRQL